ncbi:MAG: class I SAM-dependent methyltransferase [Steroidobacteraceae bacterium]
MADKAQGGVTSGDIWADFWSGNHPIYVNARHAAVHYDRIAADLSDLLKDRTRPTVVDWGCGDAYGAAELATACGELLLYDAVGAVQKRIAARFASATGIRVLDDLAWRSLPEASVDVIVMNSVAQYLSQAELGGVLDDFRKRVRADGAVYLADIIPPDAGMLPDIVSLLSTGARNGFFVAACFGLARTWFSRYRQIRNQAGFSMYTERDIAELAGQHGFRAERLPRNVGFNQQRMTFRLRPV